MIKKCLGCGITLQDQDKEKLGYVVSLDKDLCMRCFKLRHYNELSNGGVSIDNEELLNKINKKNVFVLFLTDYLNINREVISIYNKIKGRKVLVITKSDLIPKNIIKKDLVNNIKDIYDINEDIILTSSVTKDNLSNITNICLNEKKVILTGFTNAGKSSFLNKLIGSDITVSDKSNTTQDFIKFNVDGITIYDTPGFISNKTYKSMIPSNKVIPIVYQMDSKYYLAIDDIKLSIKSDSNITIFMPKISINKLKVKEEFNNNILIPSNSDLVIYGLGFIRFKNATYVGLNINSDCYEVRPTIIGGHHE